MARFHPKMATRTSPASGCEDNKATEPGLSPTRHPTRIPQSDPRRKTCPDVNPKAVPSDPILVVDPLGMHALESASFSACFIEGAGIASFRPRADGGSSRSQSLPEGRGRVPVPFWQSVGVDLQGHRGVPVAQPPGDGPHIMAGADELRGSEVTQRVQVSVHSYLRGDGPY